jgi:hypothetical protein
VVKHIVEHPGSISLQVRGVHDPDAAAAGLRKALQEIATLGSSSFNEDGDALTPNSVGGVLVVPDGPFVTCIDAPAVPEAELARIPDIIVRHLTEAGVRKGLVALPPRSGPLDGLEHTPRAVVLRLYPPRPVGSLEEPPYPDGWFELACEWLLEQAGDGMVNVREFITQFPLLPADVLPFARRGGAIMMVGDLASRAWAINLSPSLVLGFGGPDASDAELVAMAKSFKTLARRLAPQTAQAFVDIATRFGTFSTIRHGTDWYVAGGEDPYDVEQVSDQLCFEGFPYQVLGPGHVARLAAASTDGTLPSEVSPLDEGRVEVPIGDLADWLPDSPVRSRLREQARSVLAPCLPRRGESSLMARERPEPRAPTAQDGTTPRRERDDGR